METIETLCYCSSSSIGDEVNKFINEFKNAFNVTFISVKTKALTDAYYSNDFDESDESNFYPISFIAGFVYKGDNYNIEVEKSTFKDEKRLKIIIHCFHDYIGDFKNIVFSELYLLKEKLIGVLKKLYSKIYWLNDTQNAKISKTLYEEMNLLENYLRSIIDEYMSAKYGSEWFEKYSFEDYTKTYERFSEWFQKSDYQLFKDIDNHLCNLQVDDLFEVLKTAKKKHLSTKINKAIETLQSQTEIDNVLNYDSLCTTTIWFDEKLDDVFNSQIVTIWEKDFSKRRNMIAHNKMICAKMFLETIEHISKYRTEFERAHNELMRRIKSSEQIEYDEILRENDVDLNYEYCGLNSELPEVYEIYQEVKEKDDFITYQSLIDDTISLIVKDIEELHCNLSEISSDLLYESYIDINDEIKVEKLESCIDIISDTNSYVYLKSLCENAIPSDFLSLMLDKIRLEINNLAKKVSIIKDSICFVDEDSYDENCWLAFDDEKNNRYEILTQGWFCPEHGSSDTINIYFQINGKLKEEGYIYSAYGDYDLIDGIPLPSFEDGLTVNMSTINDKLENKLNELKDYVSTLLEKTYNVEL